MDGPEDVAQWLPAARACSPEAHGRALESYRHYLLRVALRELDPGLQAKGGDSDLVQETFLEAQRDFAACHGASEEGVRAWLRRLLFNNVASFARRYRGTDKRAVGRAVPLQPGSASGPPDDALAADAPSPSAEAVAQEQAEALRCAMKRLPEDYRRVLRWRYEEQRTFEQIAALLQKTPNAARKLWALALERQQKEMEKPP
jgi:RNA polymerase sigma-70 factor (ECF subfamily)